MKDYIAKSISYEKYRQMIDEYLQNGMTSGDTQNEKMTQYTQMNVRRMKRLDKKTEIVPEIESYIKSIDRKMIWLTLTEAWCGDAAQIVPVIEKIASLNPNIESRYIWRDENLDLMDQYLTDGGRGIPKTLFIDRATSGVLGSWGPRPEEAQQMMRDYKANPVEDFWAFSEKLHAWYAADKTKSTQSEFAKALRKVLEK